MSYGTGRVEEIIGALKTRHKVTSMSALSEAIKLDALCAVLGFTRAQFDALIADNSPVQRTIRGHAFELFFDHLLEQNGYECERRGGDTDIDRVVKGHTLQLKTPTQSGTDENTVQYKTHKTHGAKSEQESLGYYHDVASFADFLVGLITYRPLKIIFIPRNDLPLHSADRTKIISPFNVRFNGHPGLNAFKLIGLPRIDLRAADKILDCSNSLLPRASAATELPSALIVDTILQTENFRIWDMNLRGFSREHAFRHYLSLERIRIHPVSHCDRVRADKGDLALDRRARTDCSHFQVKGITLGACDLTGARPRIGIETQLSRGRANDHPTQSRLYLKTDFDELILCIEPAIASILGKKPTTTWEFYSTPVGELESHHIHSHRLKSMQVLSYTDLQEFRIKAPWLARWARAA